MTWPFENDTSAIEKKLAKRSLKSEKRRKMMYAKLALRNVRRTSRDYLIYVVTLILSVGMFYGFFSLASPYYSTTLPVPIHMDVLRKMMQIAVPLVGLLTVFLMSYVNSYMLQRKQREFAVETIIGMEQKNVAFLFFLETFIMGIVAIVFLEISRNNPLTQELREKVLAVNGVETMISRTSSAAFLTLTNGISDDFELHRIPISFTMRGN